MTKEAKENNILRDEPAQTIARIEGLWTALCQDGQAPYRHEITAAQLGPVLPYAFILDQHAAGCSRFRLAGQALGDVMGMDLMALPFTALFRGSSRQQASALVQPVFTEGATLSLHLEIKEATSFGQMLLLPLQPLHRRGMALGVMVPTHQAKPVAGKLHIYGSCLNRNQVRVTACPRLVQRGFSETGTDFTVHTAAPIKKPDAKRPALRLVKSED